MKERVGGGEIETHTYREIEREVGLEIVERERESEKKGEREKQVRKRQNNMYHIK